MKLNQFPVHVGGKISFYIWSANVPTVEDSDNAQRMKDVTPFTTNGIPLVILDNIKVVNQRLPWDLE